MASVETVVPRVLVCDIPDILPASLASGRHDLRWASMKFCDG
jgi:hypothetical protein